MSCLFRLKVLLLFQPTLKKGWTLAEKLGWAKLRPNCCIWVSALVLLPEDECHSTHAIHQNLARNSALGFKNKLLNFTSVQITSLNCSLQHINRGTISFGSHVKKLPFFHKTLISLFFFFFSPKFLPYKEVETGISIGRKLDDILIPLTSMAVSCYFS